MDVDEIEPAGSWGAIPAEESDTAVPVDEDTPEDAPRPSAAPSRPTSSPATPTHPDTRRPVDSADAGGSGECEMTGPEDVECGERAEIDFGWRQKQLAGREVSPIVRNRRLEYLRQLEDKGDYFTLEEMEHRAPLLFDEYIGRFMSDDERWELTGSDGANSWASQLMSVITARHRHERLEASRDRGWRGDGARADRSPIDEGLDPIDDEEPGQWGARAGHHGKGGAAAAAAAAPARDEGGVGGRHSRAVPLPRKTEGEADKEAREALSEEDKEANREEFERLMRERFLAGLDHEHFDYSKVDGDETLDDLAVVDQDAQDAWFDED